MIVCGPIVVKVITHPLVPGKVAVQVVPAPSLIVTVPVGVPVAGDTGVTTKATNTGWPGAEGADRSVVMVVVVAA